MLWTIGSQMAMGLSKAIPVTGHRGPQGCKMSKLPHFVDNRLEDCSEVSLTCRPPFTPLEDSWYSFLLQAEWTTSQLVAQYLYQLRYREHQDM
jgi:hypothetical protein